MADLTRTKLLFDSTISTPNARIFRVNVKNFYLNTPLFGYMQLPLYLILEEILHQSKLWGMAMNGWVYIKICKGMYMWPQAGILANKLLAKCLTTYWFYQCQFTHCLWQHIWRPITFVLVVDDFGIKYQGLQHSKYLLETLQRYYDIAVDWYNKLFCEIQHVGFCQQNSWFNNVKL